MEAQDVKEVKDKLVGRLGQVTVRELVLVVLCGVTIYLLRIKESFILKPAWRQDQDINLYANRKYPTGDETIVQPLITDLDSDGINEVVVLTTDDRLKVLAMPEKQKGQVLPHMVVKHEWQLPNVIGEDGVKNHVVTIETGYLMEYQSMIQVRKQVIVVAMDNWNVLCLDDSLQLLWQQQLLDIGQNREKYFLKAMDILIVPHSLKRGDFGLVIVGGSFAHRSHKQPDVLHKRQPMAHVAGASAQSASEHEKDTFTHFSTFALSGRNGSLRWHHLPGDFGEQRDDTQETGVRHHHWKLGLKKGHLHTGESNWKKYKQHLLQQLPHSWSGCSDTRFELASIKKAKHATTGTEAVEVSTVADILDLHGDHIMGYAYGGMRPHSRHEHITNPNAIVVHNHEGIEVLNLVSGQPVTHLKMTDSSAAYADINEDGNLDQVRASFQDGCLAIVVSQQSGGVGLFEEPICTSPTWLQSVSLASLFYSEVQAPEDLHLTVPPVVLKSIAHRWGPWHHLTGRRLSAHRKGFDSIYIVNSGRLTSYGPSGEFNWQVLTSAKWGHMTHVVGRGDYDGTLQQEIYYNAFKPSMQPLSLQIYGPMESMVLSGWDTVEIVSLRDGRSLADHSLPCQPSAKPVIGDFNNDGWTDIIVVCPSGFIGMSLERQPNHMYMFLLGVSVVSSILLLIWCCRPDHNDLGDGID